MAHALSRKRAVLGLVMLAGLAAPVSHAKAPDPLPVVSITLYRSGVGSFERAGTVEGDTTVPLRFDAEQINDMLKSMIVLDLDGGRIESVGYGSKEPLDRRLSSFALDLSAQPTAAALLSQLRGTPVRITTAEGDVSGTVLGVESRVTPNAEGEPATRTFVNLVSGGSVRTMDLSAARGFEILDERLAEELSRALEALAEHRSDSAKTAGVRFEGEGTRRVRIAYVHETPVWKASYRLVLPEPSEADATLMVQGWAIVENTTDEDWTDVRLSLAAGQPVGFTMDLYEPLFVDRPNVPVPAGAAARPTVYAVGRELTLDDSTDLHYKQRGRFSVDADMESEGQSMSRGLSAQEVALYSPAAVASAESVGQVFQFRLDAPVTIERQQSAMLPILSSSITGRRVSVFDATSESSGGHPMMGVELTNDSGMQLMPGPIAVYDGAAYAGDAQIGHVASGDDRLLSYAVDLEMEVFAEHTTTQSIRSVRLVDGLIEQRWIDRRESVYRLVNSDDDIGRAAIVEHWSMPGWELVSDVKPAERTDSSMRFEIGVDAASSAELMVAHERTRQTRYTLAEANAEEIFRMASTGRVDAEALEALRELGRLRAAMGETQRAIQGLESDRRAIVEDQERLRRNLGSVARTSDLHARYMTKLGEQETALEACESGLESARAQLEQRERAVRAFLRGLGG